MDKLLRGIHQFQTNYFSQNRDFFQSLVGQQLPRALFITCSDSRINPNLLTQTEPGELFILRNAGNIIPPYGASNGGEGATIEYAISALGVKQIIVCGHTHCGAMGGLLHPEKVNDLPTVAAWLKYSETTRRIIKQNYSDLTGNDLLNATIKENVLVQLENLRTHPSVAVGLSQGSLDLYGWVYQIETGKVYAYSQEDNRFLPVDGESVPKPVSNRKRLPSVKMEDSDKNLKNVNK
ncbi:MAG: carbonic anhydrase [Blastocatellia bacterium]|nr:carbonic anhydrase [Blastocatellia bacterium]